MQLQFYSEGDQFAASTGSNVNNGAGTSTFDYPPTATSDLFITSKDGDPDPRVFEVGDVYEVSWSGMGGGATIVDAVVIRSDSAGDGGAVVFEGVDENGDVAQVVWTPDFDLNGWYFDNFSGGNSPGFYTTDQNSEYTHKYVCFAADTQIATPFGVQRADRLRVGDPVLTLDGGVQRLVWVGKKYLPSGCGQGPIEFEAGALGNDMPLRVSPMHRVLVRSPMAELLFGSHEVFVPAKIWSVVGRATHCAEAPVTYVHLMCHDHQVLWAQGVGCESLLASDMAQSVDRELAGIGTMRTARRALTLQEALVLFDADPSVQAVRAAENHRDMQWAA